MRERLAWILVCVLPRRVARWLIWSSVKLPASWVPYIFGRSIGCEGRRIK